LVNTTTSIDRRSEFLFIETGQKSTLLYAIIKNYYFAYVQTIKLS